MLILLLAKTYLDQKEATSARLQGGIHPSTLSLCFSISLSLYPIHRLSLHMIRFLFQYYHFFLLSEHLFLSLLFVSFLCMFKPLLIYISIFLSLLTYYTLVYIPHLYTSFPFCVLLLLSHYPILVVLLSPFFHFYICVCVRVLLKSVLPSISFPPSHVYQGWGVLGLV